MSVKSHFRISDLSNYQLPFTLILAVMGFGCKTAPSDSTLQGGLKKPKVNVESADFPPSKYSYLQSENYPCHDDEKFKGTRRPFKDILNGHWEYRRVPMSVKDVGETFGKYREKVDPFFDKTLCYIDAHIKIHKTIQGQYSESNLTYKLLQIANGRLATFRSEFLKMRDHIKHAVEKGGSIEQLHTNWQKIASEYIVSQKTQKTLPLNQENIRLFEIANRHAKKKSEESFQAIINPIKSFYKTYGELSPYHDFFYKSPREFFEFFTTGKGTFWKVSLGDLSKDASSNTEELEPFFKAVFPWSGVSFGIGEYNLGAYGSDTKMTREWTLAHSHETLDWMFGRKQDGRRLSVVEKYGLGSNPQYDPKSHTLYVYTTKRIGKRTKYTRRGASYSTPKVGNRTASRETLYYLLMNAAARERK